MSDKTSVPETQHQRWLKYGLNVGLSIVVVILLAGAAIYLAQQYKKRIDRTSAGINSLKPQTLNLLRDLKQPVTIISLYSRNDTKAAAADPQWADRVSQVEDLLDEYKRNSNKIEIEVIDPILYPTKVDDLIKKVETRYGGEVDKYKNFLAGYPKKFETINAFAKSEAEKVAALPFDQIERNAASAALGETLTITILTVQGFPSALDRSKLQVDRQLKQKPPDYKGATETVDQSMTALSQMLERIIADFKDAAGKPGIPEGIQKYFAESLPRYEEIKRISDGITDEIAKLGELKLDSLRQSLKEQNAILVMGDNELKVLPQAQVWQKEVDRAAKGDDIMKPRFAGEQQITTAILSLTAEQKPKVVFLRPGGPPIAAPAMFGPAGPFSEVAERLREYNFTVLEKDLSGQWAMQSQMQGMPAPPEPSDEDIKDAVWIVLNVPSGRSPMGMPPPSIGPKLAEHLDRGGSALIMTGTRADDLSAALSPWGITLKPNQVIVKQLVKDAGGREGSDIERAEREYQPLFFIRNFGDHLLTRPLQSLEAVILSVTPVQVTPKEGYTSAAILPMPQTPSSWATDAAKIEAEGELKFDAAKGDLPPPLFGGAAVEKKDGGRVVAIGTYAFALNQFVRMPDTELARQGYAYVPRFPGNAELFANCVYWLAKMEPMIAISPSSSQVARIAPMSETANRTWNVGVLLLLLPGLVVAAGVMMYFVRRD